MVPLGKGETGIAEYGCFVYTYCMSKISMSIPPEALALIDEVAAPNRTAFMIEAALDAARRRRRELEDADIAWICTEGSGRDQAITQEFVNTLGDAL
jgi:hypothetical protein